MQNDRDRLIELITKKQVYGVDVEQPEKDSLWLFDNEELADYLLANGVIVAPMPMAEWLKQELTEYVHERCTEEL